MKNTVLTILAIVCCFVVSAQKKSDSYYKENPVWIQMMDQEKVVYAEAVKAFDLFWENREKPASENELFSADNKEKESPDFIKEKKGNKQGAAEKYAIEYKRFMHWCEKVQAYLNEDGTVMNATERIQQWEAQLKNRK